MEQNPRLEYIERVQEAQMHGQFAEKSSVPGYRIRIFLLVFFLVLSIGMLINFSRPAIYQSHATLLTSAATAIDQISLEADFQHVAIQRQKLLARELLVETLDRVNHDLELAGENQMLQLVDIRNMLDVKPIAETNLLSMTAEGTVPELLPLVINTWIDSYLAVRAQNVESLSRNTKQIVGNELRELDSKVEQAARELDQFRKRHDISSDIREDNTSAAKLSGLNKALNDANEALLKAKARLEAVNQSIAAGQAVVPEQEQRSLSQLETRLQELKEQLAEFDKRYTRQYLALQPSLKFIPEQIKKLESEIKSKRDIGKQVVWTQASQDYYAAQQVVRDVQAQLDEHKEKAAEFTTIFARHQKLNDDLLALQEIQRETRDRLVKIESRQYEKYPQVDVVERASLNNLPVSPNYWTGALVVLGLAFSSAFFSVWLYEFLNRVGPQQNHSAFPVYNNWFSSIAASPAIDRVDIDHRQNLEDHSSPGLAFASEIPLLSTDEIMSLLNYCDRDYKLLVLLLLSGLTPAEIINLTPEQIHGEGVELAISGKEPRTLTVGNKLSALLVEGIEKKGQIWSNEAFKVENDIRAGLYCLAIDAGVKGVDVDMVSALRNTYIVYLIQQGTPLSGLSKIIGKIKPVELAAFAEYAKEYKEPSTAGCRRTIYPLCE